MKERESINKQKEFIIMQLQIIYSFFLAMPLIKTEYISTWYYYRTLAPV